MRSLSSAVLTAIQSASVRPAFFVEGNFASGPVYLWTGLGPISWNGQTWLGVGTLGSITTIEEGATVEARGITLGLSGFDATLLGDVVNEFAVGLPVTVWLGLFDASGTLLADPIISFAGRMDQPTLTVGGDSASISINCENRLVEMNVAVDRRYTNEDQQIDYPGDQGFGWVNAIQEVTIIWGRHPATQLNFTVQGHPE
jgi:hypothetical protein